MDTFLDDDDGYVAWRDTHPDGFVLNHEREPRAQYLVLHRSTCRYLAGPAEAGPRTNWTSSYGKTCAATIGELERWARGIGGEPERCRVCAP